MDPSLAFAWCLALSPTDRPLMPGLLPKAGDVASYSARYYVAPVAAYDPLDRLAHLLRMAYGTLPARKDLTFRAFQRQSGVGVATLATEPGLAQFFLTGRVAPPRLGRLSVSGESPFIDAPGAMALTTENVLPSLVPELLPVPQPTRPAPVGSRWSVGQGETLVEGELLPEPPDYRLVIPARMQLPIWECDFVGWNGPLVKVECSVRSSIELGTGERLDSRYGIDAQIDPATGWPVEFRVGWQLNGRVEDAEEHLFAWGWLDATLATGSQAPQRPDSTLDVAIDPPHASPPK